MIRTFGIGLRVKKRLFWAFGIGPPAEIVDKSQGKYENNALGKDRFGTILGSVVDQIVPRKEPKRSEINGIGERAVRRVKEGTSAVLVQSGLDENWWADSTECYTWKRSRSLV